MGRETLLIVYPRLKEDRLVFKEGSSNQKSSIPCPVPVLCRVV